MSAPIGIRILRWTVIAAVAAAAVGGLTISGPPRAERQRQLDERRRGDLETLANRMDDYWHRTRALPPTLDALVEHGDRFATPLPRDPVTDAGYEYAPIDSVTYSLCAVFETDSDAVNRRLRTLDRLDRSTFWDHPSGRHCFTIQIRRQDPAPVRP